MATARDLAGGIAGRSRASSRRCRSASTAASTSSGGAPGGGGGAMRDTTSPAIRYAICWRSWRSSCVARERNWRATSAWPAVRPDSCSDDAHQASDGGITGGGPNRGPRSLTTTVPAKMSPIRLAFGDRMLQITAGLPKSIQISTTDASARNSGLPEAFWAAVVGHHAQAHRDLAHRAPARRGFEHHGIADDHQHREDEQDGGAQRGVELGQRGRPQHQAEQVADEDHGDIDQRAHGPHRQLGDLHIEHHGVAGHHLRHNTERYRRD